MTSEAKRQANRRNAKLSTGPRTRQGKQTASKNAQRHGLATSLAQHTSLARAARDLRDALVSCYKLPARAGPSAERFAEAEIDLGRIQSATLATLHSALSYERKGSDSCAGAPQGESQMALALSRIARQLIRLNRYHRRALSRRASAIRELKAQAALRDHKGVSAEQFLV
jgi:hypothetical protein